MRIAIVDITGRNPSLYNPSLCSKLSKHKPNVDITLCSPTLSVSPEGFCWFKLISLLPKSIVNTSGTSLLKKLSRGIETSINYLYLSLWVFLKKPDIIHFQWLPFVEYSNIEPVFLKVLHWACPRSKMFLTVHNIYPHGMTEKQKPVYKNRFGSLKPFMSGYLVHLDSAKQALSSEFQVDEDLITVAYHGIFAPTTNLVKNSTSNNEQIKIIMYGYQTPYKGADILVSALGILPTTYQNKIQCYIIGKTDPLLYEKCREDAKKYNVKWIDRFVSDEELYNAIGRSDLILLPYRAITQSGVLLLALSYNKPIITSDLPSFKETLQGYPDDFFFEKENPESLAEKLIEFVDGKLDVVLMKNVIKSLIDKYSWDETAKRTLEAYGICD